MVKNNVCLIHFRELSSSVWLLPSPPLLLKPELLTWFPLALEEIWHYRETHFLQFHKCQWLESSRRPHSPHPHGEGYFWLPTLVLWAPSAL